MGFIASPVIATVAIVKQHSAVCPLAIKGDRLEVVPEGACSQHVVARCDQTPRRLGRAKRAVGFELSHRGIRLVLRPGRNLFNSSDGGFRRTAAKAVFLFGPPAALDDFRD